MLKLIHEVRALNLVEFLNTKAKAVVVFLLSLISLGLFVFAGLIAVAVCSKWYGLIAAGIMMIAAIPFHCTGKKNKVGYLISFLLNSVANGFSVSAYFLTKGYRRIFMKCLLPQFCRRQYYCLFI